MAVPSVRPVLMISGTTAGSRQAGIPLLAFRILPWQ